MGDFNKLGEDSDKLQKFIDRILWLGEKVSDGISAAISVNDDPETAKMQRKGAMLALFGGDGSDGDGLRSRDQMLAQAYDDIHNS